jgi:cell division protein FtsW
MQAYTNLAVAMGLVPTKGLVLPFLSYGGSSLLVNCAAMGVLLNVSRQRADAPRPSAGAVAPPAGGMAERMGAASAPSASATSSPLASQPSASRPGASRPAPPLAGAARGATP